jgi:hypothetical protein
MHKTQMLHEMVFAMECAFVYIPILTQKVVMGFDVGIQRTAFTTEDATCICGFWLGCTRSVKRTYPFLEW